MNCLANVMIIIFLTFQVCTGLLPSYGILRRRCCSAFTRQPQCHSTACSSQLFSSWYKNPYSNNDSEDNDDDEDEEDAIDVDSLGDWRMFRKNLSSRTAQNTAIATTPNAGPGKGGSKENLALLQSQNEQLATEYATGVWAHETSTPEVGGLMLRMPLEVEIFRNYKHSIIGAKFRQKCQSSPDWYNKAQQMVENGMLKIAENAGDDGQIDATTLDEESAELLQLYLDNQETWQEVCLVLEAKNGSATTIVLNRPMAMKLTDNLARLVLHGAFQTVRESRKTQTDLVKFMLAFGDECALYVGGPDDQDQPAEVIHGIAGLHGAKEISPGSRIYRGGLDAAIEGVLRGKYKPLDFRFFVGKHTYDKSGLDLAVLLGKYQPVACSRVLALKQCLSLPKPLWHEVLEICGGELKEISEYEMLKRDDIRFQIMDEDDDDDEFDDLIDELDELETFDDEDEDYY